MKVLSLFDGISCGQQALKNLGIEIDKYYASEIEETGIEITNKNHPNTIQLGDVTKIDFNQYKDVDILMGGSPCQDFSSLSTTRKGLGGEQKWSIFLL